ncbi:MAG: winged helix-turn-helix transcriptional regulator [Rhizobiaceae bacterium]|nr:winged helix-turn-helix transcriptional regulator [Rhizobiaceae bacterium]
MSVDPFTAISDPNRRFLLEELRRAPKTVNELAAMLPVSRPAVSQHLKALLDNQLVSVTSEGTRRIYAINPQGFRKIGFWLDQFWA